MYFVDRSKIEQILFYMESLLQEIENHSFNSFIEKLSLERITHMMIESMLDVGNMMIDGFIMRDPGGYEDIFDILIDEKVLPIEEENSYKAVIRLRKMVVKEYLTIDDALIKRTILDNKQVLDGFRKHVRAFLDNELGVANTFSRG